MDGVHALIEKFKSIGPKKERILYACSIIEGFRGHGKQVNPAHADEFLSAVLPFMESNLNFANSHDEWICALVGIIEDHAASSRSDKLFSYSFHDSYEKAIFVVLSMVETSQVLKSFMAVLERLSLSDVLVKSLGAILVNDISYATQEIALDIICRMAMLSSKSPQSNFLANLLAVMPISIQESLKNPKIGPQGMLVDMRPSINEINKENENVKSFAITAFGIEVAKSVPYKRKISGATWLDLSKEIFTLYIPEKDMMVKFSYHHITRVHFASASNTMQIGLERAPGSIEELIQADEQPPQGKPMYFFVEFGLGNTETMESARAEFSLRLENAEAMVLTDSLEKRRKYSIISSRDQTPEDLKTSLSRFNQSRYPIIVLETAKESETRTIEIEKKADPETIKEPTKKAVVTAVKKRKLSDNMDDRDDIPMQTRDEDNLTETEPHIENAVEEDMGYSRHKIEKDPVATTQKGRSTVIATAPLVITPPRPKKSAVVDKSVKAADQVQPKVSKSASDESSTTPTGKKKAAQPTETMAKNTRANIANAKSSDKKGVNKKETAARTQVGGILIPTDENLAIAGVVKARKTSTIASALQDITNTTTPQKAKKVAVPKETAKDENNDPSEELSQPTPAYNSRRRSYKNKSAVKAQEPPLGQISVFSAGRATMRDSLLSTKRVEVDAEPVAFSTRKIREEMEREEGSMSPKPTRASTATKVKARMRISTITEEDEDPRSRGITSPDTEIAKKSLNIYSSKKSKATPTSKVKEVMKSDDSTANDYHDTDCEVSYPLDNDNVEEEEEVKQVTKKIKVAVNREVKQDSPPSKLSQREAGSQSTLGTATSWRPNAALTIFSPSDNSSSTDDSASKVNDAAKPVPPKRSANPIRPQIEAQVPRPLSPTRNESSQEDGESTYSRSQIASQDENQEPKRGWATAKGRGKEIGSGSDDDEPSSDEDGVIAMLLEELVTMQKSRATRKRARLMTSAMDAASVQVTSYLKQWSDFTDTSCTDLQNAMTLKLEALCATADSVCEGLVKDGRRFEEEGKKTHSMVQGIDADMRILQTEINLAAAQQKEEETTLKTSLTARKKAAVDGARKSIGHLKKEKGAQSNRQNTKQLMLALRDL